VRGTDEIVSAQAWRSDRDLGVLTLTAIDPWNLETN